MNKAIIFDFYRTIFDPETNSLDPGALEILGGLGRKHKLFLVSTGGKERKKLIDSFQLKRFFVKILVLEKEKRKEDFLYCLKGIKCRLKETVVIGDALSSEIAVGKSLGMKTVWFKNGIFATQTVSEENKPDYVARSLLKLSELIAKIERRRDKK